MSAASHSREPPSEAAAGTRFWVDPKEELIGIFMMQSYRDRRRLGSQYETAVYQALVD